MIIVIGTLLILAFNMWRGHSKGLVHIVLQLGSTIAAVILAAMLVAPISTFIQEKTPIYDMIQKQSSKMLEKSDTQDDLENKEALEVEVTDGDDGFKTAAKQVMDKINIPKNVQDSLLSIDVAELTQQGIHTVSDLIVKTVADCVCVAAVFIILFIIIKIILAVVIRVTDLINKIPLLGSVNKVAGLLVGAIYGIFVVWIVLVVIYMLGNMQWAQFVLRSANDNQVSEFIFNSNLILKYITR